MTMLKYGYYNNVEGVQPFDQGEDFEKLFNNNKQEWTTKLSEIHNNICYAEQKLNIIQINNIQFEKDTKYNSPFFLRQ